MDRKARLAMLEALEVLLLAHFDNKTYENQRINAISTLTECLSAPESVQMVVDTEQIVTIPVKSSL